MNRTNEEEQIEAGQQVEDVLLSDREAWESIKRLQLYFESCAEFNDKDIDALRHLQSELATRIESKKRQTKITSFFDQLSI